MPGDVFDLFRITGRVAVITGGAGLLGVRHARAILAAGGIPVFVDISSERVENEARMLAESTGARCRGIACDITSPEDVEAMTEAVVSEFGRVDILINNAANNPKIGAVADQRFTRLEHFPIEQWEADLAVGLTGA